MLLLYSPPNSYLDDIGYWTLNKYIWFVSYTHGIQFYILKKNIYIYIIIKQIYNYTQAEPVAIPSINMSISLIVNPSI